MYKYKYNYKYKCSMQATHMHNNGCWWAGRPGMYPSVSGHQGGGHGCKPIPVNNILGAHNNAHKASQTNTQTAFTCYPHAHQMTPKCHPSDVDAYMHVIPHMYTNIAIDMCVCVCI